jgi:hypothetical protein
MLETMPSSVSTSQSWRSHVYSRLIKLVDDTWDMTTVILCNAAPEGNDFAADHEEARALLATGAADGTEEADEAGPRHKVVLSASWRAMKAAGYMWSIPLLSCTTDPVMSHSELLALLVSLPAEAGVDVLRSFWSLSAMDAFGSRYAFWLSRIRHRGAFSAIYPCLAKLSSVLSKAKDWPEASRLPDHWLEVDT